MNMERAAIRGQISVKERRLREIKVEAGALVMSIREKVAPYINLEELEMEAITAMNTRLRDLYLEAKLIADELSKFEEALNG